MVKCMDWRSCNTQICVIPQFNSIHGTKVRSNVVFRMCYTGNSWDKDKHDHGALEKICV